MIVNTRNVRLLIESLLQLNGCLDNNTYDSVKESLSGIYSSDGTIMADLFDTTEEVNHGASNELWVVIDNHLFNVVIQQIT